MQRPIRFRAKQKGKGGLWVYGYVEIFEQGIGKPEAVIHSFADWNLNMRHEVDLETLGQFTGLLDKNGKEIYEGDLFNCIYHRDGHTDHIYEVVYHPDWTAFVLKRHGESCSQKQVRQKVSDVARYEVIGNIYSNPDLIK